MNRIIIFILLSSIWQLSFCQKESSFWYFGENSGLRFSGDNPIPTRGMLNTDEGCAAISDSEGNLLFYTDGTVIYNKEHKLMQNGEGLLGHTSSTQSSIIVPMASSEGIYYIFTVDGLTGESKGVHYSVVDMASDSGLGAVEETTKNTFLLSTQGEKLTAVQTQNGRGVWVITYSESYEGFKFFSYLINENGLNPNPVVSEVSQSPGLVGYLKASTKGDRLATAGLDVNGFMLFDYDNESGIVSNQRHIDSPMLIGHGWFGPYGIEFSPSGQIIYVSQTFGGLVQFDISFSTVQEISNSGVLLGESFGSGGALQLAINRKIYYSTEDANYLAVINQPDVLGQECDYQANGVRVERCEFGLPQFIQSYFVDIKIEAPDVCLGDATFFTQSASADYDSILWEFGDGFTSTEDTPQHIYSIPGEYEITLTIHKENEIIVETAKTVVYPLPEINEMVILKQCDDDLDGYSAFALGEVNQELILNDEEYSISYYSNLSDAETGVNLISNTNRYINSRPSSDIIYARVENPIGCYRTAQVKLYVSTTQIPSEFKIQVFACDEMRDGIGLFDLTHLEDEISSIFPPNQQLDIMLYNSLEDALEEVNPVLLSDSYVNAESPYSQYLWVRVDSRIDNDCLGLGRHISLEVLEVPLVELKGGLLCEGNPLLLDAGEGFDSYQWSNGESTNSIVITEPGIYRVTATIEYEEITCEAYQEVEILGSGLADLIGVRAEGWDRMDNLVVVEASGSGDYEYSIDGVNFQDSPKFENIDPRFNTVYVNDKNGCGIVEGKFYILYYPRFFTPNGDGENDRWHLGNANMEHGYKVSIFNRYGRLITQLTSQSLGWDGTYMGRPSPSTDYWFVLERFDGKRFTGHFSLRR